MDFIHHRERVVGHGLLVIPVLRIGVVLGLVSLENRAEAPVAFGEQLRRRIDHHADPHVRQHAHIHDAGLRVGRHEAGGRTGPAGEGGRRRGGGDGVSGRGRGGCGASGFRLLTATRGEQGEREAGCEQPGKGVGEGGVHGWVPCRGCRARMSRTVSFFRPPARGARWARTHRAPVALTSSRRLARRRIGARTARRRRHCSCRHPDCRRRKGAPDSAGPAETKCRWRPWES